jgi:hypothetical protein
MMMVNICIVASPKSVKSDATQLAQTDSGGRIVQEWGFQQLGLQKPLALRTVEQNLVAVGLPNRGELSGSGAMQTKIDAATLLTANKNPLAQPKSPDLKLIMTANGCVDVFSKTLDTLNLLKTSQHCRQISPINERNEEGSPFRAGVVIWGECRQRKLSAKYGEKFGCEYQVVWADNPALKA